MAEHSATAEGENCAYGPTLDSSQQFFFENFNLKKLARWYVIFFSVIQSDYLEIGNVVQNWISEFVFPFFLF